MIFFHKFKNYQTINITIIPYVLIIIIDKPIYEYP
jgi:hypothetical protein